MLTDAQIIARCLAGRPESFGELVRRYQGRLYPILLRILGDAEEACDALQDTFLDAYRSLAAFEGRADFYTWLHRIAVNRGIGRRRQRLRARRLNGAGGTTADLADPSRSSDPTLRVDVAERLAAVQAALAVLPAEERSLLILRDMEGVSYEQLAARFDVPVGTIRSRLHRARFKLRGLLEQQ